MQRDRCETRGTENGRSGDGPVPAPARPRQPLESIPKTWTPPYCGIAYLGVLKDERWVAVEDHGDFALLFRSVRGASFRSRKSRHPSVEAAQRAGERWIAEIGDG